MSRFPPIPTNDYNVKASFPIGPFFKLNENLGEINITTRIEKLFP